MDETSLARRYSDEPSLPTEPTYLPRCRHDRRRLLHNSRSVRRATGLTPPRTEGPFYPDRLPLDTDNDLIILNDSLTPSVGEITHLTGRVLDTTGSPIRNATVEIWQCDANQVYLHTA